MNRKPIITALLALVALTTFGQGNHHLSCCHLYQVAAFGVKKNYKLNTEKQCSKTSMKRTTAASVRC